MGSNRIFFSILVSNFFSVIAEWTNFVIKKNSSGDKIKNN
jgi:hypothetical protein